MYGDEGGAAVNEETEIHTKYKGRRWGVKEGKKEDKRYFKWKDEKCTL